MILCARNTTRSSEQSAKRKSRSHSMRKVVYSIIKMTRLYDYQTWRTYFEKFMECAQVWVFFFLIVLSGCWLAEQENPNLGVWYKMWRDHFSFILESHKSFILLSELARFIVFLLANSLTRGHMKVLLPCVGDFNEHFPACIARIDKAFTDLALVFNIVLSSPTPCTCTFVPCTCTFAPSLHLSCWCSSSFNFHFILISSHFLFSLSPLPFPVFLYSWSPFLSFFTFSTYSVPQ